MGSLEWMEYEEASPACGFLFSSVAACWPGLHWMRKFAVLSAISAQGLLHDDPMMIAFARFRSSKRRSRGKRRNTCPGLNSERRDSVATTAKSMKSVRCWDGKSDWPP